MSARSALDISVDLERNRAEGSMTFDIDELFVDGELRLRETAAGWEGYRIDGGAYYYVDTTRPEGDWARSVRIGEQAITDALREHLRDEMRMPRGSPDVDQEGDSE